LGSGLALAACSGSGNSGGNGGFGGFGTGSILDTFNNSSKATRDSPTANALAAVDPDLDCPTVELRTGAATLLVGGKPGEGPPSALDVRYQGSITRTARECHVSGGTMTVKVGIEGRVITGPAGAPGVVEVPLRIAVVREGPQPKTIVSRFGRETVNLQNAVDRATFTHIDPDVSFAVPLPSYQIRDYVIYVGFDPVGAQPPKKSKRPVRKRKKPTPNPNAPSS